MTQVEVATSLALDTYGTEVALVMVFGFVMNLVFAKITPWKAIFLTGQHFLYFACVLALVFIALGAPHCRHRHLRRHRPRLLRRCPAVALPALR